MATFTRWKPSVNLNDLATAPLPFILEHIGKDTHIQYSNYFLSHRLSGILTLYSYFTTHIEIKQAENYGQIINKNVKFDSSV
jgi:chromatin segregation and condensation protein Rec8/ScpA/Scc1 (kleisin family)